MKQYFLKLSAASLLLGLIAVNASAQDDNDMKSRKKTERSDLIIVKTNDGKDTKVTIEVKDGEVKVNGKPLSEFKDDNVSITRRKAFDNVVINGVPGSRFRSSSAWTYNGDDLAGLGAMSGEPRSFLGVTTEKEGDGARITDISDESAAQKAGLKEGDIIIRINDQKVNSPEDLTKAIHKYKPEEKVTVVFKRDGKEQSQSIVLGKRTESTLAFAPGQFNMNMDKLLTQPGYSYSFGPTRGRLGIKAQETEDGKGLKVLSVEDESPADNAGIKEDDIITEFDGTEVNNVDKLREVAVAAAAKVSFKVKLIRDGKPEEVQVKIPKNLKTTNL